MNILQKAYYFFRRNVSLTNPADWFENNRQSYAGETVTASGVLSLSAAWACVNLLAGTIGSLPLFVYREDNKNGRRVNRDHSLYRILHDSPNYDQTAIDFWEFICASLELWGNAYARKDMDAKGEVVALTPILPDIMSVRRDSSSALEYRWTDEGKSYTAAQDEILHIRGFGGSPLGGHSTLTYGRNTFGLASAIDRAAGGVFANGLRPSGVLTFDKFLTEQQRQIAESKLAEKFVGAVNAGRPMVLEGGTKWAQLTINPEDAQMLQSRGFSVEDICRFFGVPPFMIGHTEKVTSFGSGLEQQVLGFQKFTLRRRLKRIEQALEKQLLTAKDRGAGVTIEFNLEGLLRGDSAARSAFYNAGLTNGWLMINEVRERENLPPVEGGDVPRMQMQNVPISDAIAPTPVKPRGNANAN